MKTKTIPPELSRPLSVDKIPAPGLEERLEASPDERQKLTERFGLLNLSKLEAMLHVEHANQRDIAVIGSLTADVVQQCVVTLESLRSRIEQPIDVIYTSGLDEDGELQIEPEGEDMEIIQDGVIDLGELVAQQLGIALDPYPRKPGISFGEAKYGDNEAAPNPFAKLADWGKKPPKR